MASNVTLAAAFSPITATRLSVLLLISGTICIKDSKESLVDRNLIQAITIERYIVALKRYIHIQCIAINFES
jgi:hypothetical protein